MKTSSCTGKRPEPDTPSPHNDTHLPGQRTPAGQAFTAANLDTILSLQHCNECGKVQYPPRELCQDCLADALLWRVTDPAGTLLSGIDLHHSLREFYQRHIQNAPWPIASVRLSCGAIVFAHIDLASFTAPSAGVIAAGTAVAVFSHRDMASQSVLIAVARGTPIAENRQRSAIARNLGLLEAAIKAGGI